MVRSKNYLMLVTLLLLNIVLTGCGTRKETGNDINKENYTGNNQGEDLSADSKDEWFHLVINLDKSAYTSEELILCYATLEYIGEDESITVYSSDPLLGFGIKDDKYFSGGYAVNDILMETTFQKGQVVRYEFMKSGGWDGDDPNARFYEEFYSDPNLILPPGEYEISAAIHCSMDREDILGSQYSQAVSVSITVSE